MRVETWFHCRKPNAAALCWLPASSAGIRARSSRHSRGEGHSRPARRRVWCQPIGLRQRARAQSRPVPWWSRAIDSPGRPVASVVAGSDTCTGAHPAPQYAGRGVQVCGRAWLKYSEYSVATRTNWRLPSIMTCDPDTPVVSCPQTAHKLRSHAALQTACE